MNSPAGHDKTMAVVHELTRKLRTELEELLQGEPPKVLAAVLEEPARLESRVVSKLKHSGEVLMDKPGMDPATVLWYGSLGSEGSGGRRRIASDDINFSRRGHRRRGQQYSWMKISDSIEDGHTWRKYGQKYIKGTRYQRSYFSCPHKKDRGCRALRKVQAMDEDPSKYMITYVGDHSCKRDLTVAPNLSSSTAPTSLVSFQHEIPMSSSLVSFSSGLPMLSTDLTHVEGCCASCPLPVTQAIGPGAAFDQAGKASPGSPSYVGSLDMGCLGDTAGFDDVFSFNPDEFLEGYINDTQFPPYY